MPYTRRYNQHQQKKNQIVKEKHTHNTEVRRDTYRYKHPTLLPIKIIRSSVSVVGMYVYGLFEMTASHTGYHYYIPCVRC